MLNYRLIAADLDGTLLDSEGQISNNTKKAVREYHELGGLFTLATGRMEDSAIDFADELEVKIPIIAFNGGKVISPVDRTILFEAAMDPELAVKAYNALKGLNKCMIVYRDKTPYATEIDETTLKYMGRVRRDIRVIEDISDVICPTTKKILVIDPKMEFAKMREVLTDILGDSMNCVTSDKDFFEVLPVNVSKGRGLELIADSLGIPMAEVIAIGDHPNDISMIKAAGLGVAVRSAESDVLAAADYITSSNNEDGVACVIEKVISGEL
jgi:Cof subfamily protein (haloacid dehalogenase superfamily)